MTDWKTNLPNSIYDHFGDLQISRLFMELCNSLPHEEEYLQIDISKARVQLMECVQEFHPNVLERVCIGKHDEGPRDTGTLFTVSKDLLVKFYTPERVFHDVSGLVKIFWTETTDKRLLRKVRNIIRECFQSNEEKKRFIHLVSSQQGGLDTSRFRVEIKPVDLTAYFNDSLFSADQVIQKGLTQRGGKALILLHGEPGTGKTSYIRHLVASVDKPFIYLPPSMTHHIADPAFVSLLSEHKDSVLVVEDADNALMTRNGQNNSAVSNLLNLTDGLLADCFNLKVICTINTHVSRIDPALLRKGRLLMQYHFQPLEPLKVNSLLESLNREPYAERAMTLAEIFNPDQTGDGWNNESIGFRQTV